jgi:glutathione S-transferase
MTKIILHGFPVSPFARSVAVALEIKGAPYDLRPIEGGAHSDRHRQLHPFAKVPAIEDGDYRLYETQAILRYLDARFPEPSLQPTDPRALGRMSQVLGILDCYLFPQSVRPIGFQRVIGPAMMGITPDEAVVTAALPSTELCLAELNRLLGDQPFLAGEVITLADVALAPHLHLIVAAPEVRDMLQGTRLASWLERMLTRPAMVAAPSAAQLKLPTSLRETVTV